MNTKTGLYHFIALFYDQLDYLGELLYYKAMRKYFLPQIKNKSVLEVGVGTGKNFPYYAESNDIYGIDSSNQMLRQAQKRLFHLKNAGSNIRIKLSSISGSNWGFRADSFDMIVATFVLCTQSVSSIDPILDEMYRVLRLGGHILLFEWYPDLKGITGFLIKLTSPIINLIFGPSVYRKPTISFFINQQRWKIKKVFKFANHENHVILIQKLSQSS